jgi:hypothetical protein
MTTIKPISTEEEKLKNIILTHVIPAIDVINYKIHTINSRIICDIYQNIIGMIEYHDYHIINILPNRDNYYVCEIDLGNENLIIKDSKKNPEFLEATSTPFINKRINLVTISDSKYSYIRVPKVYVNADINYGAPAFAMGTGINIKGREEYFIISNYFKHLYEKVFLKAANYFFENLTPDHDYNRNYIKSLDIRNRELKFQLCLFFVQDDTEIIWYCTLLGEFWGLTVFNNYKLYFFLKLVKLSGYNIPEEKHLDHLLMFVISKAHK